MIFKSIKILTKNWMNGEREHVQKLARTSSFKKITIVKRPKKNSPLKKTTIIRKQPIAMEMFLNFHLLSIIISGKIKNRNFEKKV
jgi:hypothetical protein